LQVEQGSTTNEEDRQMDWLNEEPIRAEDLSLVHGDHVCAEDQLEVIGHHFRDLTSAELLRGYFNDSSLGASETWMVRWRDAPIAHLSAFPCPLWIDGKPVVVGKPEAQVLHPDVIYRRRPDVVGMLWKELIQYARDAGWPLLIGLGNEDGNRAMRRRGFRDLKLPAWRLSWPLTASGWRPYATAGLARAQRLPPPFRQVMDSRATAAIAAGSLHAIDRTTQLGPNSPLTACDMEMLRSAESGRPDGEPSEPRIRFRIHTDFLKSRFDTRFGYQVLVISCGGRSLSDGVVVIRRVGNLIRFFCVEPTAWLWSKRFWRSLAAWARRENADVLAADLYANNPSETAAAKLLRRSFPLARVRLVDVVYSLMVLDPQYEFANEPEAWAGAGLMGAGF
jgi:hypothetical protein